MRLTGWTAVGLLLLTAGAGAQETRRSVVAADPALEIAIKSVKTVTNPVSGDAGGPARMVWAVELDGVDRSGADEFFVAPERTRIVDATGRVLSKLSSTQSFSRRRQNPQDPWSFSILLYFRVPPGETEAATGPAGGAGGPPPPLGADRLLVVELDRYKVMKASFAWPAEGGKLAFPLAGAMPGLELKVQAPEIVEDGHLAVRVLYENLATGEGGAAPVVHDLVLHTAERRELVADASSGDMDLTRLEEGMVFGHGALTQRFLNVGTLPELRKVELEIWRSVPWEESWVSLPAVAQGGE